jgi:hypothetical protein
MHQGDFVVFKPMVQELLPIEQFCIENLVKSLKLILKEKLGYGLSVIGKPFMCGIS